METLWNTALWMQFGAAIDMLENALVACPAPLWNQRLWRHSQQPEFAEFWYLTYHTLFWLDLYLSGSPEEDFAPRLPLPGRRPTPQGCCPNGPIRRRNCTPISRLCARSATTHWAR